MTEQRIATELPVHRFTAEDGTELAWREVGSGPTVVVLHALFGSGAGLAGQAWVRAIVDQGHRVVLPDLRGHGESGGPHDPGRYPPDVLAADGLALLAHLGLTDYALAGYSLGGKLVLRLLARGARPARAVVVAQGLDALDAESDRTDGHRRVLTAVARGDTFPAGSPEEGMARWVAQGGVDPLAVRYVLDTMVATPPAALREVPTPVLIAVGEGDSRSGSAAELAGLLPNGRLALVPGDHGTVLAAPEFSAAVLDFLGGHANAGFPGNAAGPG